MKGDDMKIGDLVRCKVTGVIGLVGGEVLGRTVFVHWYNGAAGASWVHELEVINEGR
jgi:hypothetical protein